MQRAGFSAFNATDVDRSGVLTTVLDEANDRFYVAASTTPGAGRGLFARLPLKAGGRLAVIGVRCEPRAPATWNRYRALLSLVFRQAIRNGKLTDNPARRVPHMLERNERVRFLSPEEEKKIRATILERPPQRLAEFDLALHTGLRLSEQYGGRRATFRFGRGPGR